MTVKECIGLLLSREKMTQSELAEKLGIKGQAAVAVPLSRNEGMGMRVETLVKWLEALDCQICIEYCGEADVYTDDLIIDDFK